MRLLQSALNRFSNWAVSPLLHPQPQSPGLHPTATPPLPSPHPQGRAIKSFMLQLEAIKAELYPLTLSTSVLATALAAKEVAGSGKSL